MLVRLALQISPLIPRVRSFGMVDAGLPLPSTEKRKKKEVEGMAGVLLVEKGKDCRLVSFRLVSFRFPFFSTCGSVAAVNWGRSEAKLEFGARP